MRFPRSIRALALGLVAPLLLAGCAKTLVEPEVGMCFSTGETRALDPTGVEPIPCTEPHQCEVVGLYEAVGGPFPGNDTLAREAHGPCTEQFEQYTGAKAPESVYDLYPLLPTEAAWDEGDTTVLCIARLPGNELLTRSVKDTGR